MREEQTVRPITQPRKERELNEGEGKKFRDKDETDAKIRWMESLYTKNKNATSSYVDKQFNIKCAPTLGQTEIK